MKLMTDEHLDLLSNLPEEKKNFLRKRRAKLLSALDIYDKNVLRGRVSETAEEKDYVDKWWQALKDIEEWAFEDRAIPQKILRYL